MGWLKLGYAEGAVLAVLLLFFLRHIWDVERGHNIVNIFVRKTRMETNCDVGLRLGSERFFA
ncbi:MAG: hypothetical protein CMM33_10720 [Rhodospirillaceae bacterium]|nr:hypothetical protein [Rhodospirillaceae bacterium]